MTRVDVIPVAAADEPTFAAVYQFYRYDFTEFTNEDVDDDGQFHDEARVNKYLSDARHSSFLFRADGRLAGLAVVRQADAVDGSGDVTDMEQFFVMRRYRRQGIGEAAAIWLFDRHPGRWQVRERHNNLPAQRFWRTIIGRYAGGRFDEIPADQSPTGGPVQFFISGGAQQ
jgi:predicted acetyltransferase